MGHPFLRIFFSEKQWAVSVADEILKNAPKKFSIAVSGGSTPVPIYHELSERDQNWKNTDVFVIDERFVPAKHTDSNQKLIREHLKINAKFHFWQTESDNWEQSAREYNQLLREMQNPIDVGILGIGEDGHTASLFPKTDSLTEENLFATISQTHRFAVQKRLTMTFPTILSIKKLIVLLKGKLKKEVLTELFEGKKTAEEFPAKRLLEHKNFSVFYADV